MKLFKKKVRVIPESYLRGINSGSGSGEATAETISANYESPVVRDRQLAKSLHFAHFFIGFIPAAFYFVYLMGFIFNGAKMDQPELLIPLIIFLTIGAAGFFISLIWEKYGGVLTIIGSLLLGVFMTYIGADMLQYFIYPLPFFVSGVCAIYENITRARYKRRLREQSAQPTEAI